MKITKKILENIIKEEIDKLLSEAPGGKTAGLPGRVAAADDDEDDETALRRRAFLDRVSAADRMKSKQNSDADQDYPRIPGAEDESEEEERPGRNITQLPDDEELPEFTTVSRPNEDLIQDLQTRFERYRRKIAEVVGIINNRLDIIDDRLDGFEPDNREFRDTAGAAGED